MELSFSPNFQTLPLISGTFPSTKSSIRREFLGSSHNLRPPGGFLRGTKCSRKLRLRRNQSQSLLINASFGSDVLVLVAVSTVSALSVAYFNHHIAKHDKNKKGSKQAFGSPTHNIVDFGDNLNRNTENKDSVEKTIGNGHVVQALVETSEYPNADFLVSNQSDASNLSSSVSAIPESGKVRTLVLNARGMSEFTLEKSRNETEVDFDFPQLTAKRSNTVDNEAGDKVDLSNYYDIIKESVREDLYKFYEDGQSMTKSPLNFNGSNTVSSHASSLIDHSFSSLKVNGIVKGADLSAQQSPKIAETAGKKVHLAHYERGSSQKKENIWRRRGFPREKENTVQDDHTKLLDFPYPNGVHKIDKGHPSEQVHAYSRLLRDGR